MKKTRKICILLPNAIIIRGTHLEQFAHESGVSKSIYLKSAILSTSEGKQIQVTINKYAAAKKIKKKYLEKVKDKVK